MHAEAPTSVTYKITSPTGFNIMLTFRAESEEEMFKLINTIENKLIEGGYKNQNGNVIKHETSSSNGDWKEDPATDNQKKVLTEWGVWKDGITKGKASKIISERLGK